MSTTLSHGVVQPTTGEKGTWWNQLNANFAILNDHTHNGTDAEQIAMKNLTRSTSALLAAAWGASGSTTPYKQTVTLPTGLSFDTTNVICRLTSTGDVVYPKIVKLTTTTFDVYVNDNTVGLTIVYA